MADPPAHRHCTILSTGDELVIGQLVDTNSAYLADRLTALGIVPVEHATVGDDLPALVAAIARLAEAAPLLIMTGGLGPTDGDLTRAAMAEVLGEPLVEDPQARQALEALLKARGRPINPLQLRQAQRPVSAACLPNALGTAPGLHAVLRVRAAHGSTDIYCLPGPPNELRPMFQQAVAPRLHVDRSRTVLTRLLHVIGMAESEAAQRIKSLTARDSNPLVGITASGAVLTVRIRFQGQAQRGTAEQAVDEAERMVREQLGASVFGAGDDTIAGAVLELLKSQRGTIATVESCTGGLLGAMLSEVPGSSAAYVGGWVTYSNQLKTRQVGVPAELLEKHGAVSEQVARAMAVGGLERSGASHCLAITGIAGPGGGTATKPVGTVYIALAISGSAPGVNTPRAEVRHFLFPGDRQDVRARAARSALAMTFFATNDTDDVPPKRSGRLLWEQEPV